VASFRCKIRSSERLPFHRAEMIVCRRRFPLQCTLGVQHACVSAALNAERSAAPAASRNRVMATG
jgi:hypothetical protein